MYDGGALDMLVRLRSPVLERLSKKKLVRN